MAAPQDEKSDAWLLEQVEWFFRTCPNPQGGGFPVLDLRTIHALADQRALVAHLVEVLDIPAGEVPVQIHAELNAPGCVTVSRVFDHEAAALAPGQRIFKVESDGAYFVVDDGRAMVQRGAAPLPVREIRVTLSLSPHGTCSASYRSAVIAHEIAHLYLYFAGAQRFQSSEDITEWEEELRTDVAAICLGLGSVIVDGYRGGTLGYLRVRQTEVVQAEVERRLALGLDAYPTPQRPKPPPTGHPGTLPTAEPAADPVEPPEEIAADSRSLSTRVEEVIAEAVDTLGALETEDAFWVLVPPEPCGVVHWMSAVGGEGSDWNVVRSSVMAIYEPSEEARVELAEKIRRAAAVMHFHNHPGGSSEASPQDERFAVAWRQRFWASAAHMRFFVVTTTGAFEYAHPSFRRGPEIADGDTPPPPPSRAERPAARPSEDQVRANRRQHAEARVRSSRLDWVLRGIALLYVGGVIWSLFV